jgi:hypothetical protein
MKVKQLIKKLSEMDPEANIYIPEGPGIKVSPIKFIHYGLHFKRDKYFALKKWMDTPGGMYSDKSYLQRLLDGNKMDNADPKDVLLSSWSGEFGDE